MPRVHTRFLTAEDVPRLLELEQSKWEPHQSADAETLAQRIRMHPKLSIGSFCIRTGRAQASLFLCPVIPAMFTAPTKWESAAKAENPYQAESASGSLFGISLSSNNADAVKAILKFFYPYALKHGWQDIYLGSPMPGFKQALTKNPKLTVWQYAHAKRKFQSTQPLDPQLRYYFNMGFTRIISIQEDYFPHEESMHYGVILRGKIPLSKDGLLGRLVPFFLLESLSGLLFS